MLKNLAIVAMFILLQVQPLQPQAPTQSGNHPTSAQDQQNPEPNSPIVVKRDNQVTCSECSKKGSVATEDPNKWVRRGFWINFGLTLITLIIAGATWRQASAAKSAVDLSRCTAKKQLRAYLAIVSAELKFFPDGFVEAHLELGNSGQTPAYKVIGAQRGLFSQYPLRNLGTPPAETRKATSIIAPGKPQLLLTLKARPNNVKNPGEVLLVVQPPHFVFCAHGRFEYEDIFKDRHFISFQMIFGGPAGIRVDENASGMRAKMAMDTEGNEGD